MNKFDNLLLFLGFATVIGLFTLAFVVYQSGGQCLLNPINYAIENNLTNPYLINP
ncbi:hypothetical protein LCGC14_1542550 [marine sediment metagenome]|uniref:Uncharacterized protein n=1 Tax=marine sediment metagenome TaxID=412755 RepID=A0A0F9LTF4_9ZZZZ